ncbi:MAG: sulfatase-like hydrolase/transferase [Verrucomicrobiota bacterium]
MQTLFGFFSVRAWTAVWKMMMKMEDDDIGGKNLPQVVVVLTSQWRAQALGYAGDPNAYTPCLDALAESSVDFCHAVTPHPFGVFARAAFMTGEPSPENGVKEYFDSLPKEARTLAHRFSDFGYETAFFGKWQLYERNPDAPIVGEEHAKVFVPQERRGGFDVWEGFESGHLLNDIFLHGTEISKPTRFFGYQSDVLVERMLGYWDRRDKDQPLFAVLSMDAPHPPYAAPAGSTAPYEESLLILDEGVCGDEEFEAIVRKELAGYYAHIEATDAALGRLMDGLKERGDWERTLFVFTSVHGDMHGTDGKFRKGWPHEEAVRVPLLMSWPERIGRGRRDPLLISLLDLGATLLGMVGADCEGAGENEGQDLSRQIFMEALGPEKQRISMPSVPPFAKQCPYVWRGSRTHWKTEVEPEGELAFTIEH